MIDINNIKNISIIGAGFMGYGIAHVALLAGFDNVIIYDINKESVDKAEEQIKIGIKRCEEKGKLSDGLTTDILMLRLKKELDLKNAAESADFIIEAVPERLGLKREIYGKLGKFAPKNTILASNTSFIDIGELGKASGRSEKVVGMHFLPPIIASRVIEVTRSKKTSNETMDICAAVGEKLPCISGDRYIARIEKWSPGFIMNRVLCSIYLYFAWVAEEAMEKGIPWEQLDADVITNENSMGLCETWDYIGLDVAYDSSNYLKDALSPDFAPSKVFAQIYEEGNFGAKTGKGFYEWPNKERYFFEWTKEGRPKLNRSKKAGLLDLEILIAIGINEGCKLIEEGIVPGYKVIDDVLYIGSRGQLPGPFITGKKNYLNLCKKLEDLVEKTGKNYFKPCDLMKSGDFLKMRR